MGIESRKKDWYFRQFLELFNLVVEQAKSGILFDVSSPLTFGFLHRGHAAVREKALQSANHFSAGICTSV